jgi:polysaccharide deacetylase family protein (PEP-CTERM system associated)
LKRGGIWYCKKALGRVTGKRKMTQLATFSVDWEDFGQLLCWYKYDEITPPLHSIYRQTETILALLNETGIKATFFVLGMLAEYRPDIVKMIYKQGHEIAIHGYSHKPLTQLSRKEIWDDIDTAIKIVSDIIGEKIHGFRAPIFSIQRDNLFILEILSELGIEYDSSIFPVKLPRYGISGFPQSDCKLVLPNGKSIIEFPLTYLKWMNVKIPISGGGYLRLLPSFLLGPIFNRLTTEERGFIIYSHPYEFDPEHIDIAENFSKDSQYPEFKRFFLNLKWNLFRGSFFKKTRFLLSNFDFLTCKERMKYVKDTECSTVLGSEN